MAFQYDAWGNPVEEGGALPGWNQTPQDNGSGAEGTINAIRPDEINQSAYDFSRYNRNVSGIPTLDSNAFDNWQSNDFLSRMVNTAQGGSIYTGLNALLSGTQDFGAATGFAGNGNYDPSKINDSTYQQLATYMGIDPSQPNWKQQVLDQAGNYAMVKGMVGSENDPRASKQILYQRGESGWNPILNYDWSQREKGSWWDEGGSMIMVPLSVVAGGLAAGAGGGASAGSTAGGITGTGGATGLAAYGGGALGSTLGTAGTGSLGAGLAGAAGTGSTIAAGTGAATGLAGSLANAAGYGQQFSQLPTWAQGSLNGALNNAAQSALTGNDPLRGAVTGAIGGAVTPALSDTIKGFDLGQTMSGALQGAGQGGLNALLSGGNPLTGALLGGAGGATSGGFREMGMGSNLAGQAGNAVRQLAGNALQGAVQRESLGGQQQVLNDVYSEAERRGISRQQIEMFLQTPQGRQAIQALLEQQGKGTLQSLFG